MSDRENQAAQEQDPLAGTAYRLVARLTNGAMGEIVEAHHVPLRRRVIIKLIHPRYAAQPGFLDRFRLEAQALAALAPRTNHIVGALDVGETPAGRPFLVLEKLTGRTLKAELTIRGTLPPIEAIGFARDLLDALRCAHEAGIVHRDVKPENIFLAESQRSPKAERLLKLLDFGIAKVLPGASDEHSPAPLALPTEEGTTLGTPRYLSPEQARGGAVDHRSDLYSAGAVLHAMLVGADPFAHIQGMAAILRAHVLEPPRPPSLVASQPIPPALDRIVLKALAKDRADRFASAADFSQALIAALASLVSPATTATGTELMDVTVFRGAGPAGREKPLTDKTEPLDTVPFAGGLRARGDAEGPVDVGAPVSDPRVHQQREVVTTPASDRASERPLPAPRGDRRVLVVALVVLASSLFAALVFALLRR